MKRREFIQFAGASTAATIGVGLLGSAAQAQSSDSVTIRSLGHMCFLFTGDGRRILVNPFRPIGCTAGYAPPQVAADLVMISSRLLDEGVVEGIPNDPQVLFEPGVYEFSRMQVQGIRTDHDTIGGKRFGVNVVWRWNQGGLNFLHMGGAAAPITVEQQILMGRPDVLLIPVGNGAKSYTPEAAKTAMQVLNPRIVIPTQYRTTAADPNACDLVAIEEFLALVDSNVVRQAGNSIALSRADLPDSGYRVTVMSYTA